VAELAISSFESVAQSSPEQPLAPAPTGVAAFVGRTLKGPTDQPVVVTSFAQYQRVFGGLWQASTVSYAVEQFFENGGRTAIVVRVANGAQPPTLTLPGRSGALRLSGIAPGSREFLRASVDYDGIAPDDDARFNLVVQRVGGLGSERIEEQEIFRRVSTRRDSGRFVADAMADSALVRVVGDVPLRRPSLTPGLAPGAIVGYVGANNDGDDGRPVTDYDVIGSVAAARGLFALQGAPPFNLLCIPPLDRDRDVGASTLLVAAKFCRERQALLVVDPPASWHGVAEALEASRSWPFRADNALMFFPRIVAMDRLRGRYETFGNCGAIAGALARSDEGAPPWRPLERGEPILRASLRATVEVSDADAARLQQHGVNAIVATSAAGRSPPPLRTLATGNSVATDWRFLGARRLAQFVAMTVEQGTRWVAYGRNGPDTWRRARGQVEAFLESLDQEGAFAGTEGCGGYFVICDERLNGAEPQAQGRVNLLFGFASAKAGEYHACLVTHRAGGSAVRAVSVNRLATSGPRVDFEIESTLLRGLAVS
jgi:hypothetical protein